MKFPESPPFDARLGPGATSRFLSNGRYHLLLTPSGSGYSEWDGIRLGDWRGDRTEDKEGFFLYLRDHDSSEVWRLGGGVEQKPGWSGSSGAARLDGRIDLFNAHSGIECLSRVFIPPDINMEVRRLSIRNLSNRRRTIEIRSLINVVLNTAAAHAAHPVFSRLFLQTEVHPEERLLLAHRRPRSPEERFPDLFHTVVGGLDWRFETDRGLVVGRRLPGEWPQALVIAPSDTGRVGNVLDPVLSLSVTLIVEAGGFASADFALGVAGDSNEARQLARRLADRSQVDSWMAGAEAFDRRRREDLGLTREAADSLEALAGGVLYGEPSLALDIGNAASTPATHQEDLVELGVESGRALALLDETGEFEPATADELETSFIRMARYWAELDLPIDAVIIGRADGISAFDSAPRHLNPDPRQREALRREARLLVENSIPVSPALFQSGRPPSPLSAPKPGAAHLPVPPATPSIALDPPLEQLRFDNGIGGFSADGREYVVRLNWRPGLGFTRPPLPWTNVVANENFGLLVSEIGAGSTWSGNSREHRLTPWSNDPLLDPPGECFYVRDEDTGRFWSPLPGPAPLPVDQEMRHGFGYSRASMIGEGLEHVTEIFVARHDPVRFTRLHITNRSGRPRRLSLYAAYRLVLGTTPAETGRFLRTDIDGKTGALMAENLNGGDFAGRIAFADVVVNRHETGRSATADRAAFLGLRGSTAAPLAVQMGGDLDGRTGSGLDPAFAHRIEVDLPADGDIEVTFLLGDASSREEARMLIGRYDSAKKISETWDRVRRFWTEELAGVQIETPSPALDLMVNGWLPYQTLACRIWGRTAFYQSGGAFGFRDQLQDAAALMLLWPDLTREQILRHAAHQFLEGDVLHWWHPPRSAGIRTRFVDDLLWLPGLTAQYVAATGDDAVLDKEVSYLAARLLDIDEDEAFVHPELSGECGSVYEHCIRSIDRSLTVGEHGLPLFGTGDWNDGMNRVGRLGRGESVWMGFFLYQVLGEYLPLCEARGDEARATRYRTHRNELRLALNDGGWDGAWYRRGYYDSGAPLGSTLSDECRIDALAQAWAVLSGAAPEARAHDAMDRVEEHLISEPDRLIRLLTPPFERTTEDPGYIKGYVAGVRENGGQYTHAALWVVRAMAELGRNNRAARLLDILNPVLHSVTPEQVARYQVEPYVVAADVYSTAPHVGRGGWTWYTGSSGWMYRVALESILGLTLVGGKALHLKPCIPDDWPGFTLRWRRPGGTTVWEIKVDNQDGNGLGVRTALMDGVASLVVNGAAHIQLVDDGQTHRVELRTGAPVAVVALL
ncbi:MAG: glycosyl transferase [Candidatus Eisenbacteria bacterium]|nr:glycosyl transferase [Candidatus Eisenbacteria bacterium]